MTSEKEMCIIEHIIDLNEKPIWITNLILKISFRKFRGDDFSFFKFGLTKNTPMYDRINNI